MLLVIVIFTVLFLGIEISYAIKNKHWKELCVGSAIIILAISYGLDLNYQWQVLPNPGNILMKLQPLTNAFIDFFHLY
ncbi:MAG: hypothetical protein GX808_12260 [Syntrophomonadaceae bacterium]|jgi:hypothetical protein|nr:hypothetical protein [Syntrophomonadaceae bacterium]